MPSTNLFDAGAELLRAIPDNLYPQYTKYTLEFTVGVTEDTGEDEDGNPILISLKETVQAYLQVTRNVRFLRTLEETGVDSKTVPLEGRLVSPLQMPDGVKGDDRAPLEIFGQKGVFVLKPFFANPLTEGQEILGQRIYGIWESM